MPVAAIELLAKIGMMLINLYLKNKELSEENKKIFVQSAEILRRLGATTVRSRYESESQINKIDEVWKDRESK